MKKYFAVGRTILRSFIFPALALVFVLSLSSSQAALVYWDTNGVTAGVGGSTPFGNWGAAYSTWGNSAGTAATAPWVDGDTAVFAAGTDATGTYTVNLSNAVTVAALIREEGTPTINGGANVFTFAGGALSVDTGSGTLTLSSLLAPANGVVTKTGSGIFSVGTSQSSFAGKWICNAGTLSFPGDLRIGILPGYSDQITLNGARLRSSTANVTFDASRGIVLGAGGGGFNQATTTPLTWNGVISGNSGGNLTFDGASGSITVLAGVNTYDGNTIINGGTLRLGASGVIPDTSVVSNGVAGVVFDLNGFDETVKSIAGGAGTIALGTKTLTINNPNGETYSSSITGVGGGKIVKSGSGKLALNLSNGTFDGGVTLNAGILGIGANPGFGTGPLTINNSVTVAASSSSGRAPGVSRVNLNGDLTFDDSFVATPGTFTWGSAVPWTIQGANRTIKVNTAAGIYTVTINGPIGQDIPARGLIKIGNGILSLGATNTYSGDTTVNAGLLQLTGNGSIGDGTGTLHLSGGGLNTTASRVPGSNPVPNPIDLTTDAAITTSSAANQVELNFTSATIGGSGTLTFRNDGNSSSGVFQPRFTAGGLVLSLPIVINNGAIGATMLQSYNSNTAPAQIFNSFISGSGSYRRTASAPNVGGDTIFTAANTFFGGATLGDGGIGLGINSAGSPTVTSGPIGTGALTINPFGSTAKLFASGGPRALGNAITFAGSPLTISGADNLELSGSIALGASTRTITLANTALTTISGNINSSGGGLTTAGAGTLVLSGANNYSGDTTIGNGAVIVGNAAAIPSGAGKGNLSVSSILDLNGQSIVVNGLSGSGLISNGVAGPITFTVGGNDASGLFSGTIIDGAGSLSLIKVGTNKLVLAAANTFSGSTTISNGTLVVSNAALASASVTVGADGILAGSGAIPSAVDLSGTISPGASPGTLATATENWNGGGYYLWQINNATNIPGADPGWDLLSITGGLNITAAASNKFTIDVVSLSTNVPGLCDGFDPGASNVWLIAQVTDGITNFDANAFHIAQAGFSNDLGGQIFAIAIDNDTNLVLTLKSNSAPSLTVPADQTIDELTTLTVTNTATDPDAGTTLTFSLLSPPTGMIINPTTGVISWTPSEAQGPGSFTITVVVSDDAQTPLSATNSFNVTVNEVNSASSLATIANQTLDELTTLNLTASATDADIPANTLTYSLDTAPAGMTIDSGTGAIGWTPGEADGPGVYTVKVVATDNGTPTLSATNTFTITVNEVNSAPSLTVPANQTINEQSLLSVSASASDSDIPANTLTFSLHSAPVAMTIDPNTGAISWTPTEADGPAVYTIAVAVTDNGTPSLSVTNTFTVTVNEVNNAPSVFAPADQTIDELTALNVSASATDPDFPANALLFSLGAHPSGMTIVPGTGAISWTPSEAQGPSTNIIEVVATDNGVPPLSATNVFTVTVHEVNVAPSLTVPSDQTIDELTSLNVTNTATDPDLPANTLTFSLGTHPTGMTITPDTGIISWTPTEAQGPSSNLVEVIVTDDGSPVLSATNTFSVIVNEVNSAPGFTGPGDQTISELTTLNVSSAAIDSDIPANTLTYALLQGPAGMTIDPNTGAITWPTTEADGPSSNVVIVSATDDGTPPLSATNTFTVVVTEVNSAPLLTIPADQTINELATLNVSASATDSDLPANTLTFGLLAPPVGMTIVPGTGAISWTPTEGQGPSTNVIIVVVTDNGTPPLSTTNSFTVTVNEVNTAPSLPAIADRTIHAGQTLVFTNSATDPDVPANTLTYSLDPGAPATASIGSSSGAFTWTTIASDENTTNAITVRVTDDGTPALNDTKSFTVTVVSAPTADISVSGNVVTISWTSIAGQSYRVQYKNNLGDATWTDLAPDVTASGSTASATDTTVSQRFYRVAVLP
jgi:autotransporter-associated beta strand protein